ncbi:hypothetical protein, partial [Mycobacterium avium]
MILWESLVDCYSPRAEGLAGIVGTVCNAISSKVHTEHLIDPQGGVMSESQGPTDQPPPPPP